MRYYPVAVDSKGKRAIVVGGGKVAERKIDILLKADFSVKLIAPSITSKLKRLAKNKKLTWVSRKVRKSDIWGTHLVIAATDDKKINKDIGSWSKKTNFLYNIVDRPDASNFISPAIFRRGKAIVAVYTDGRDPVLSRDLKNFLKENWSVFLSYRNKL